MIKKLKFIEEVDDIFNSKLDKACYSNFNEVYAGVIYDSTRSRINRLSSDIDKTLLYADMQLRLSFDSDLCDISFTKKVMLIQNNIIVQPICHCGNLIKYSNSRNGLYNLGCCTTCINLCDITRIKTKQTNLERYGVAHVVQSKVVQEKIKQTNLERYGVEYPVQNTLIREKTKQTNVARYGVESPLKNEEIQEKIKQTNLVRYGVENPQQSGDIREKTKQTNLKRYGVEHVAQSKAVQEKIKQTNLKRYGVENVNQTEEIRERIKRTNFERYGFENPLQSKEIREKVKQTNLKRYGVEYIWQNVEIQEKIKQTNLDKYGVEYISQCVEIQEKVKQTNLERYGVENPFQSAEVQDKIKQTNLERYGVENPSQSKEVQEKSYITYLENHIDSIWDNILSNTHCIPLFDKSEYVGSNYDTLYQWKCTNCNLIYESYYCNGTVKACPICTKSRSLGEIELYNYIQSLIPDIEVIANDYSVIPPKELDIYIPSLKLAFEYNGDYWHSLKEDGYHEWKTSGCEAKDIRLYHILESDWKLRTDEIKLFILSLFKR